MALIDQAQLAQHEGFRSRVLISALNIAMEVMTEASSGDARTDDLRRTLAVNTLQSPDTYDNQFAWATASTRGITYTSTDGDVYNAVKNLWNAMAGV
jgi:hypothetical protein